VTKVSQFSNGVYLCRLFDIAFPKRINLAKLFTKTCAEYESQMNLKMLYEEIKKV
jgi:hypothetical protein